MGPQLAMSNQDTTTSMQPSGVIELQSKLIAEQSKAEPVKRIVR